jgi:membrane protease YdiL (CAAX protease family)
MSENEDGGERGDGRGRLRLVKPDPKPDEGHEPESWPRRSPEQTPESTGPYPDPRAAFWLTLGGVVGTGFIGVFFFGLGMLPAIGIGHAIAVGALASIAARRVAEPQAERIGLRSFDPRALPMILCLVPAILVISELDNWAADLSPTASVEETTRSADFGIGQEVALEIGPDESGGDEDPRIFDQRTGGSDLETASEADPADESAADEMAEATGQGAPDAASGDEATPPELMIDPSDPWTIAQAFVISAGIAPLVDEFFFRGVIQQSMVVRLGLMRGIAFVALLYTMFHLPAFPELPRLLMGLVSSFGLGMTLGLARAATGSILAPILLASLWSAIGVLAMALRDRMPLPGMNVDGTHLPIAIALGSFAIVAWALREVTLEARRRHAEEKFD